MPDIGQNSEPTCNFDQFTDEQLVAMAEENSAVVPVLLRRYVRFVSYLAHRFADTSADKDDYTQEGFLGLLSAISAYSPERHASFRTFAATCIRNRMRNLSAAGNRSVSQRLSPEALSIDDASLALEDALVDAQNVPDRIFDEKACADALERIFEQTLSGLELECWRRYLSGMSYDEIAEAMGLTTKAVDNAVQRSRRKLRAVRSEGTPSD